MYNLKEKHNSEEILQKEYKITKELIKHNIYKIYHTKAPFIPFLINRSEAIFTCLKNAKYVNLLDI